MSGAALDRYRGECAVHRVVIFILFILFIVGISLLLVIAESRYAAANATEGWTGYLCPDGDLATYYDRWGNEQDTGNVCKYGDAKIYWKTGAITRKATHYRWRGATPDAKPECGFGTTHDWAPYRLTVSDGTNILYIKNRPYFPWGNTTYTSCEKGPYKTFGAEVFSQSADIRIRLRFIHIDDDPEATFCQGVLWTVRLTGPEGLDGSAGGPWLC